MSERLTNYQLGKLERAFTRDMADADEIERLSPYGLSAIAELRTRRVADLSDDDREAIGVLAFLLNKHHHEPYAYEGEEIERALAVLDRLAKGAE